MSIDRLEIGALDVLEEFFSDKVLLIVVELVFKLLLVSAVRIDRIGVFFVSVR